MSAPYPLAGIWFPDLRASRNCETPPGQSHRDGNQSLCFWLILLGLAQFAAQHWNPALKGDDSSLVRYKFQNYVKEVYYDSDTNIALLSGAPFDDPSWWLLSNEQIVKAREVINDFAGSRRLLAHTVITPN